MYTSAIRRTAGLLCVLAITLLALPSPAGAAGTVYSGTTWAGVRASKVLGPNGPADWRTPAAAQAKWNVPCLPETYDGAYGGIHGAYDQWIGLEAQDQVGLIQVGVRSYHLDLFAPMTGHFAWMVNTASPSGRSPVQLFSVPCGSIITAKVWADGDFCITTTESKDCTGSSPPRQDSRWPMSNPAKASFIVERFAGGTGHIPYFGWASFRDAKVMHGNGTSGWLLGTPSQVQWQQFNMVNPMATDNVWFYKINMYGTFSMFQPQPPIPSYDPHCIANPGACV